MAEPARRSTERGPFPQATRDLEAQLQAESRYSLPAVADEDTDSGESAAQDDADGRRPLPWFPDLHKLSRSRRRMRGTARKEWGAARLWCARVLETPVPNGRARLFDVFIGVTILYNVCVLSAEANAGADPQCGDLTKGLCSPAWVRYSEYVLMGIYTVEVSLRLFAYRSSFFCMPWAVFDLVLLVLGYLDFALKDSRYFRSLAVLRLLRVVKLARGRVLTWFPTLRALIVGFSGAMHAMMMGLSLIILLLVVWAILAVTFINPINSKLNHREENEWCRHAFSSVPRASLLFFQTMVAGDSWGTCIVPLIREAPHTGIVFVLGVVLVELGLMNLILAVIVDKAVAAREQFNEDKLAHQKKLATRNLAMWREIMKGMDVDGNGTLTLDEVLWSSYTDKRIQEALKIWNIKEQDLITLFHLMDTDGNGSVEYIGFVDTLYTAQMQDSRAYMMMLRLQVQKLETTLSPLGSTLEDLVQSVGALAARQGNDPTRAAMPLERERLEGEHQEPVRVSRSGRLRPIPLWGRLGAGPPPPTTAVDREAVARGAVQSIGAAGAAPGYGLHAWSAGRWGGRHSGGSGASLGRSRSASASGERRQPRGAPSPAILSGL